MAFKDLAKDVRDGELRVAEYWDHMDLLKRSIEDREGCKPYVFFDGPPTANGTPGIHHVIARTLKDLTCRYKTMQGFQVKRKAGWDTHGLPVEIEVEKQLGFTEKKQIEDYGVEAFNKKCKESVFRYRDQWMEMSKRMAFLADMEHPYITLDNDYIETVWHLLDHFFEDGLIYKGAKILPYCPRCGTGLASHEVAQGYREDTVTTATVKFKRKDRDNEFFLAWTTTPWTLPSNVALTVNPEVDYVRVRQGEAIYYLAADLKDSVLKPEQGEIEVLETMKGKALEYVEYEQLLPFIDVESRKDGRAFFVTCGDYVTTGDGTGIVHSAPAFGEDDYNIGRAYGLKMVNPVGDDGKFTEGPYAGTFVMDADPEIIEYLKVNGKLYSKQRMTHNYPHCWRCGSPLIYYSKPSWYIEVTKRKEEFVRNNQTVNWYPEFVGEKRFGNWLENLNDWAISRSRYWGTPLPIWVCEDCGHVDSVGSRQELAERAIEDIDEPIELHRPYVDDVHLRCPHCGGIMKREPDVVDVWFDSGAMPFAQWHYPFENRESFDELFPADFISEGIDQTRGWFYSLLAISTLYKGVSPYRNVLVNELVLDKDGRKMSKSKGNTINPFEMFDRYGADAVRFYSLYVSPPWMPTKFDIKGVEEVIAKFFRTIKNVYAMFALYANTNRMDPSTMKLRVDARPEIDRWLLSRYNSLIRQYQVDMDSFEYTKVVRAITDFVAEDLSNWYIRRNRRRFWSSEQTLEVHSVFVTTWEVMLGLSKLIAPITPFLAEALYLNLTDRRQLDSVHLEHTPVCDEAAIDPGLEDKMALVRKIVNLGRASREDAGVKVRQPLSKLLIESRWAPIIDNLTGLIEEELNVKHVQFSDSLDELMEITLKPNYKLIGKVLGSKIKAFAAELGRVNAHELLARLNEGEVVMTLNGEETVIDKSYIEATYLAKEGFDVMMDDGVSVVLDTQLDDELIREGYMREFVSKVQQRRKSSGFEVSDRIHIAFASDEVLVDAIREHDRLIREEVLALDISFDPSVHGEPVDINGHEAIIVLEKAN